MVCNRTAGPITKSWKKQRGVAFTAKSFGWCPPEPTKLPALVNRTVEGIPRHRNPSSRSATAPGGTVHSTYRQHRNSRWLVRIPNSTATIRADSTVKSREIWRQPVRPGSGKESAAVQRNFARFDERNTVDHDNFGKYMPNDLSDVFNPPE